MLVRPPRRLPAPILTVVLTVAVLSVQGCVLITPSINPFRQRPEPLEEHVVQGRGRDKILLLDISRTITNEEERSALGLQRQESTVARVEEELRRAADDDRVKAVVLRINSPGGTVTASDVIFNRLMTFKQARGLPIVAHFMDTATSGAYYVALAADEIVASPTSVTGSIGVVLYGVNLEGLLTKIGVKNQTIKSGEHKDIGSPLRQMTPEESAILQSVLNDMQTRFVGLVHERRPESARGARADDLTDGRVLTAKQAFEAGLVDRIGYLDDALESARRRAGAHEARIIMYRRPGEYAENIYSQPALSGGVRLSVVNFDFGGLLPGSSRFMYLWLPGAE